MKIFKSYDDVKKNLTPNNKDGYIVEFMSHLIGAIIMERKKRGLSQEDIANIIEVDKDVISDIETWNVRPDLNTVIKIAYYLNIEFKFKGD